MSELTNLREAVDSLADRAAPLDLAALEGRATRRGRRRVVLVAAAAAAVIAGSAVTVTGPDDDRTAPPIEQPVATKNPVLTRPLIAPESLLDVRELGFQVAPVDGIEETDSWGLDSDGQWINFALLSDPAGRGASVKVLYQGRSPRPLTGTSEDVTVNGLAGTYTEDGRSNLFTARLSWQYAPDSWAEVGTSWDGTPPPDLRRQFLAVAEAVRSGGSTLRVPVRFDSAPASLPAIAKAHRIDFGSDGGDWRIYVWLDDAMVSATTAVDLGECLGEGGERQTDEFTYRGFRGCVVPNGTQQRIGLHLDGVDVTYDFDPGAELPREDIKRLLAGVTVAPPSYDPTRWFDLKTALGR
jgi:hypothetical protein